MSQVYCVLTVSQPTIMKKTTKKLVLGIGCMKFVFYGQEESFVVQFAIENINFHFQLK